MTDPKKKYERRGKYYLERLEKQDKNINLISYLRLFDVIIAASSFIFFYRGRNYYIAWGTLALYSLIFLYLVIIHNKRIKARKYISALCRINEDSIKRFTDEWKEFVDDGKEFKNENHPFSDDLDIFGRASLFQWINTCNTNLGRNSLRNVLMEQSGGIGDIKMRQEAVVELSQKLWWRQRFSVEGKTGMKSVGDDELFQWALEKNEIYGNPQIIFTLRIMPLITISTMILSYIFNVLPSSIFLLLAVLQLGMLFFGKRRNRILGTIYRYKDNIKLYSNMIIQLEKTHFSSTHINKLKSHLISSNNKNASNQIRALERIVDSISNRKNMMFLPINILFLWDFQCMVALEKWREQSGDQVKKWIEVIGEMEALSSLAQIRHDYPNWVMPVLTEKPSVYRAKSLGHPLITNHRVNNDLVIEEPSSTLLITGSNMSGKSTFLRTTGINLVLAYSGAPVCAEYMECSKMNIYTCMRIGDNLEKSISSFYAEILRIKDIVLSAKGDKQVFFLLDEIFKGTNSQDRHAGAKLLINKLGNLGAVGLVSTHDLELGEMEKETGGKVKNFHFREYYKESEIYFDYKLRPGVSTTSNAMYLIKMAGIDEDI